MLGRNGLRWLSLLGACSALLLSACVTVEQAGPVSTPEPWTVTSVQIGEAGTFRINYYDLAGEIVDWSISLTGLAGDDLASARLSAIACVRQATVGSPLPDCARSLDGLFAEALASATPADAR